MTGTTDVYVHIGRCPSEYPMRMHGYISKKLAVLRSVHDDLLYVSYYDEKWRMGKTRKAGPEVEEYFADPNYVTTKPWLILPDRWPSIIEARQRFKDGKIRFFWEIVPEKHFSPLSRRDDQQRFFETRAQAEKHFLAECKKAHEYSYTDAVANAKSDDPEYAEDQLEQAEEWKTRPLVLERTETRTWAGCDENRGPEEGKYFDGIAYGFLVRRELNAE